MRTTSGEIATKLGGELLGSADRAVSGPETLARAGAEHLAYFSKLNPLTPLLRSQAGTVFIPAALEHDVTSLLETKSLIRVPDPQASFLAFMQWYSPEPQRPNFGISPRAHVDETARIGAGTNVYPGAVIGANVVIGENCDIHPGVCIGANCRIGNECILYPYVVLYDRVELRNRVLIHASSVIGADGFGYRQVAGRHEKIPHYGNVLLEDDVEIGACATIDRSFLGSTKIGEGSKIDNLVVIAHNCELGKHNILVSQVGFAGSVTTGDYVVCAGQVGIADHVHLGTGSVYGAKCGVHKDMPAGQRYIGAPAEVDRDFLKQTMALKKLPELRQQVKDLTAIVQALQSRLDAGDAGRHVA